MNKILLNNEEYKVTESDLPYLIAYGEKSGGSHFTVSLTAQLFSSGSKILFFTAFPMAKDNFLEQIGSHNHSKISFINSVADLDNNKDSDVIILNSGDEDLFIEVSKALQDIHERIVLVKNIEAFSDKVFDASLYFDKLILSGDIDKCVAKEQILKKTFNSTVVFTKPESSLPFEVPALEKWTGYLLNGKQSGMIKVQIN